MSLNIGHDVVHPYILKLLLIVTPGSLVRRVPIVHRVLSTHFRVSSVTEWNQRTGPALNGVKRWSIRLLKTFLEYAIVKVLYPLITSL